jgi:hypothetical protein
MPITAIVEFSPTEGLDPREGYDRLTRELNGGEPMTRRSQWNDGLLAHSFSVGEDGSAVAVDVWRDQQSMDAWMERIRPLNEREGSAANMQARVFETHAVVTEGLQYAEEAASAPRIRHA